jgi:3-oxoacyl-[acyl-carrier protein] reductase
MFDLQDKVAFVTGGSRGIGRACAEALAERGAHVVLSYVRGEAEAAAVVAGIRERGGKADAVCFDVSDWKAAEQAVEATAKQHGKLDLLVANAGISIDALLPRVREEDLDRVWSVNVKGSLGCAKAAIKWMMRARYGRIVLLSSVTGEAGNAGQVAYSSSKAALIGAAKTLAREYASRSVTVNVVSPGFIDTDMTAGIAPHMRDKAMEVIPLKRSGTPREVAAAVVYLCSDEAAYVTGQVLRVNGGMYC